ncbi:MAG: bifunctional phosphoribosyl-AMP cyclohydrolase/phosphoribosyl-ATP diphosphatase HisIE [Oligoflexia bacterium]|nr:bifunctional phosphoribosyl-AMP cyclohydrolase/phosphoribosyl-ATP diphosphatase HisIE [Oligoflexia bacterium]
MKFDISTIDWEKNDGLIPAVIQDVNTLQVLMLGYMNKDSLQQTLRTDKVTFWSRTKKSLWTKGQTSGNFLTPVNMSIDCDNDTLLIQAIPDGPTCHTGAVSCFSGITKTGAGFLGKLFRVIEQRHRERPINSYTSKLFDKGLDRIAQKVGEEAVETVIASKNNSTDLFLNEAADLIFHLLVLVKAKNLNIDMLMDVLEERHK